MKKYENYKEYRRKNKEGRINMVLKTLIIKRTEPYPHYEVHRPNSDIVEFWDIELKRKIGESKVEKVE